VALIYPAGWAKRCGPTITWREPMATRHVPGRGLFGGYDMARLRPGPTTSGARPVQASLFDDEGQ